ncbi:FUSC family protein [Leifsonia sp. A12D58]|uniref:FUSC family protein n=1 Tax=Leifsonia sp. A12D58 TaxID=3397674 RepID=UPI0039E035D8
MSASTSGSTAADAQSAGPQPTPAAGTMPKGFGIRLGILIVLIILPMIIIVLTPLKHEAYLYFLGTMPAMLSRSLHIGVGVLAVFANALVVPVAILSSQSVMSGTLLMILLAVIIALSSVRGWNGPLMYVGVIAGLLVTSNPPHVDISGASESIQLWYPALLALFGGLWGLLLSRTLMKGMPVKSAAHVGGRDAFAFGVALAILLGFSTAVAMTWFFNTHAGWVLLTILLVVKADYSTTTQRVWHRSLGTIAGGLAAALLAVLVHNPLILQLAGAVFGFAMLWVVLTGKPYYVMSAVITPTIVLINSSGNSTSVFDTDLERVAYTLVAGVLILLVIGAGQLISVAVARREKLPDAPIATE